jgi:3-oxoacyl-[acyl-carrier protein] reductase
VLREEWFEDSVAVVTGGASGLGLAIATAFADAGCRVAVVDRSDEGADAACDAIRRRGGRCGAYVADVVDKASVERVVDEVVRDLGAVSILVAGAGVYPNTPFLDLGEEEWDHVVDTNLKGTFLTCQATASHMKDVGRGGCIVTIASGVAVNAIHGWAHYTASKAAVVGLTRSMALELGPHGIRVNTVLPGYFEVGAGGSHLDPAYRERAGSANALGRPGANEELASAVMLLASPGASFVTGVALPVDGGSSAGRVGLRPA